MALNIFETHNLLMAVQELSPVTTFLRDRYFPTNDETDIFSTNDVLVEYRDGNKKLAPFVAPRKGGVTILRNGYHMERFTPPNIAPRRILTLDDLNKKGFGEALFSKLTPAQRQAVMLIKDLEEMGELITRREEAMAAETLLNNGCVMKHIADDIDLADEREIRFYEGDSNPAVYTPAATWDDAEAKIIDDIAAMIRMLTARGLPATDLIVAPDVAAILLRNAEIKEMLDIRHYNLGGVDPALLPSGAAKIARLNIYGRMIDVLSYDETYEDGDKNTKQFIPSGHTVLTAPACGRTLYGAVSQVEQTDGEFHTYAARRVPKYISSADNNTRTITLTSCPLLIPNNKNAWITAKVTA